MLEDEFCQGFESLFAGNHGAGAALLFIRRVQVFERGHGGGGFDGSAELVGQLALFFNRSKDGSTALIQPAQAGQLIGDDADLLIVERAGHFFAVTGNEGDGVAIIQ